MFFKKPLIIIIISLIPLFGFCQSYDNEKGGLSKENYYKLLAYGGWQIYIDFLRSEDPNLVKKSKRYELLIELSNFNDKYGEELINTIAIALGSNNDELVHIDINLELFKKLSSLEQLSVLIHEFNHDFFNVMHTDINDELNIMHPFALPNDQNEMSVMLRKFLRDYLNGNIDTFSEGFFVHDKTKNKLPYLKKF